MVRALHKLPPEVLKGVRLESVREVLGGRSRRGGREGELGQDGLARLFRLDALFHAQGGVYQDFAAVEVLDLAHAAPHLRKCVNARQVCVMARDVDLDPPHLKYDACVPASCTELKVDLSRADKRTASRDIRRHVARLAHAGGERLETLMIQGMRLHADCMPALSGAQETAALARLTSLTSVSLGFRERDAHAVSAQPPVLDVQGLTALRNLRDLRLDGIVEVEGLDRLTGLREFVFSTVHAGPLLPSGVTAGLRAMTALEVLAACWSAPDVGELVTALAAPGSLRRLDMSGGYGEMVGLDAHVLAPLTGLRELEIKKDDVYLLTTSLTALTALAQLHVMDIRAGGSVDEMPLLDLAPLRGLPLREVRVNGETYDAQLLRPLNPVVAVLLVTENEAEFGVSAAVAKRMGTVRRLLEVTRESIRVTLPPEFTWIGVTFVLGYLDGRFSEVLDFAASLSALAVADHLVSALAVADYLDVPDAAEHMRRQLALIIVESVDHVDEENDDEEGEMEENEEGEEEGKMEENEEGQEEGEMEGEEEEEAVVGPSGAAPGDDDDDEEEEEGRIRLALEARPFCCVLGWALP